MWSGRGFRLLISSPRWQTDAVSYLRSYPCVGLTISARSHHSLHDVDMPRETRPPGQTFTGAKATGKSSIGRVYAPNTSNLEHRQAAQRPCGSPRAACVIAATSPWATHGLGVKVPVHPMGSNRPKQRVTCRGGAAMRFSVLEAFFRIP